MTRPGELTFADLRELPQETTELWVTPSIRPMVAGNLPFRIGQPGVRHDGVTHLVAIGGGSLLDAAKVWRADRSPTTTLIAVPSVWGSGAEVSPVVVENVDGKKIIRMDDTFLPDKVVYWPELAEGLPDGLARNACGDSWSHAIEGFLSPLADDSLRAEIAILMHDMLATTPGNSPLWFRLSADACALQARSSVGLIHGIAHTLEGPLRAGFPGNGWSHAKLCATYLWPVIAFDCRGDGKANRLLAQHSVPADEVIKVSRELHDEAAYRQARPMLGENWRSILRDQCTRTNVRLVRPSDIEFFERWAAQ